LSGNITNPPLATNFNYFNLKYRLLESC